jgi:hypothetical protein
MAEPGPAAKHATAFLVLFGSGRVELALVINLPNLCYRPMSRASLLAETDAAKDAERPFSLGSRPVIRWIKGDGLDDEITRSVIAQATRLFGASVDYCLCSAGISPARARAVLAWAEQRR